MASTLPQYAYDPVTQTYRLMSPQEQVQAERSQAGGLYNLDGGDATAATSGPGMSMTDPGMAEIGVGMQNLGVSLSSVPGISTAIGGAVASSIGNSMMGSQVSPVSVTSPEVSQIGSYGQVSSGLAGLAEAISEADESQDSNEGMAEAANAAASAAADAADAADSADADAGAASAAAAGDSGGGDGGSGDGGGGDSGGDSGGDTGDAGDSGDGGDGGGDGGDGERAGGMIKAKRYAEGGIANPQGILRYNYDPRTQQYALVGREGGGNVGATGMGGISPLADLIRQAGGLGTQRRYDYNPQTQQYTQKMAEGGVAAANYAQKMGRGNDTMLVHMTPGEVGGLQALAKAGGGSLTINPNTGLPEAGFLSSMLPMVAGAALTGMTGGVINPMTASLLVGGGYGLATGSLKKGLMAGLGAFGGANIAAGLGASAAAGTAENLAAPAVESTMATPLEIAQTNIDPSLLESGMSAEQVMSQGIVGSPTAQGAVMSAGQYAPTVNAMDVANLRTVPSMTVTGVPATSPTGFVQGDYMGNLSQMGKGAQNLMASGPQGTAAREAFMSTSGGLSSIAPAAAPVAEEAMKPPPGPEKKPSYIRRYDVDVANRSELGSEYAPGSSYERQMMDYTYSPRPVYAAAAGGLTALSKGGTPKKSKKIGGDSYYKFAQDRRNSSMEGALEANFATGGQPRFLSGGGDGMSDDIPATIDDKQPARLADGEFVVPADVVSHLGNGSSKAGAKKLYKMMDRIRQARTGKKSQAPEVKAERHMPA